ncbi:MAG: hypothetical protein ACYCSS_13145 [Sulfuriferula sp.]
MKIEAAILICLAGSIWMPIAQAETCTVNDSFWLQPRSGVMVLDNQEIKPCITTLQANDHSTLVISYSDTDEASVSADELRQWLIALALPATRIVLKKLNTSTDPIRLEIPHD